MQSNIHINLLIMFHVMVMKTHVQYRYTLIHVCITDQMNTGTVHGRALCLYLNAAVPCTLHSAHYTIPEDMRISLLITMAAIGCY
jgi:hypothetical protein